MNHANWCEQTFGLRGRTALVTGARTGIGRACALALAQAGADLVLWGRDAGDLGEIRADVAECGRSVKCVGADLSDLHAVGRTTRSLLEDTQIDVLVNNGGTIHRGPAIETTLEDWRNVMTVNLDAVFLLSSIIGASMVERGAGKIVNIASILSFQGGFNALAYAASKHGVAGLTKALANEWAVKGVNVNAVAPGYITTNNTELLLRDSVREPAIRARIPAGRWAAPEEVAGPVVFLASSASDYVNGHVLVVDGGWLGR